MYVRKFTNARSWGRNISNEFNICDSLIYNNIVPKIRRPLEEGPPGCEGFALDVSPGSSVVMKACYSLDFSYFRNLHPAFSYPFIPACFMMYFACWIAAGNCLEDDNGAQGPTHLPSSGHVASAPGPPGKPSKIMMFQAWPQATKSHQNWSQENHLKMPPKST